MVTVQMESDQRSAETVPLCIACGNRRKFWVETPTRDQLVDLTDLPDGAVVVRACGRCSSRRSIIVAHTE
jgi:hypothetical protein